MKSVSIIGATFVGNRGAEAMLSTVIRRVLEHDPEYLFNVYSYFVASDKKVVADERIRLFSADPFKLLLIGLPLSVLHFVARKFSRRFANLGLNRERSALAESRALIDISGVSFMDSRAKNIVYDSLVIAIARLLGVPVIKLSQAMGPFNSPLNKVATRLFLARCAKIFARGNHTHSLLKELPLRAGQVEIAADIVFSHQIGDSFTNENPDYLNDLLAKLRAEGGREQPTVGVCPSSVVTKMSNKIGFDYIGFVHDICAELLGRGYRVVLFPNATRQEHMDKMRNNDLVPIRSVVKRFQTTEDDQRLRNLLWVDKDINADGIMQLIQRLDIAVVSRFHAMIGALAQGVPTIVLGWSHKYREVMEQFGQQEWVLDYKALSQQEVAKKIELLLDNRDTVQSQIVAAQEQVKSLSWRQFEFLFGHLDQNTNGVLTKP